MRTGNENELVDIFENEVSIILNALGHPEAMTTDMSEVGDFLILIYIEPKDEESIKDQKEIDYMNKLTLDNLQSIFHSICEVNRYSKIGELAQKLYFDNNSKTRTIH